MSDLVVALIQTTLVWEDARANRAHFEERIQTIKESTDLILLPEMFTTGFSMNPRELAERMDGDSISWMYEQASKVNSVIAGSLIIQEDGRFYNRFIAVYPDGRVRHYDKRHRFTMGGEHLEYAAGNEPVVIEVNDWKIGLFVCYDLRFPVWMRNSQKVDLQVVVANWPGVRSNQWSRLLPARAIENQCYVAAVNRIGVDGKGVDHSGNSVVLDFFGEPLAEAHSDDCILRVPLNRTELMDFRSRFPVLDDADAFDLRLDKRN